MCNNCYCENYEKCSIVGYQPFGFCCNLCVYYDETLPLRCSRLEEQKEVIQFSNILKS
jgi:hypothetical protein